MSDIYRTEDKTMPAVCYALYLLGFATAGLTAVAGAVIAYAQRGSSGPDMRTHYTYLIRTFWGVLLLALASAIAAGVIWLIGLPLTIIGIGFAFWGLAGLIGCVPVVWFGIRCVVGLVYLARGEPHPRPYAVLA